MGSGKTCKVVPKLQGFIAIRDYKPLPLAQSCPMVDTGHSPLPHARVWLRPHGLAVDGGTLYQAGTRVLPHKPKVSCGRTSRSNTAFLSFFGHCSSGVILGVGSLSPTYAASERELEYGSVRRVSVTS